MPEPFLQVENAGVVYGRGMARRHALRDISLEFPQGRLTLVIGPSGSGKTTLLSLLGCLMAPDSGSVYVAGRDVTRLSVTERTNVRRRNIGFVFQAFRLLHALSAVDNVAIAGGISGKPGAQRAAEALLEELGLADRRHLKPDELSGGEKQRVAIARALMADPPIILADEPTASLDTEAGRRIFEVLVGLAEQKHRTVVVVSHDRRWEQYTHRLITLQDGQALEQKDLKS